LLVIGSGTNLLKKLIEKEVNNWDNWGLIRDGVLFSARKIFESQLKEEDKVR
jgi:hypothetical protein